MKRFARGVVAVSSLAMAATGVLAVPASATESPSKEGHTAVEEVNDTVHVKKGEACHFAVTVKMKGTFVHFEQGRRVVDTTDGYAVISNDKTGKRVRVNTDSVFIDHYAKDGNSTHSLGYGSQLFWGDMSFGHHRVKARMVYIQGETRFRIRDAKSEENSYFTFSSVEGKFRDICKELRH